MSVDDARFEVEHVTVVSRCRGCGEFGDFNGDDERPILNALHESGRLYINHTLKVLEEAHGHRAPSIERILGLRQRSIAGVLRNSSRLETSLLVAALRLLMLDPVGSLTKLDG